MDAAVDSRQQRGLALSRATRIKKIVDGTWLVPSQTSNGAGYVVNTDTGTCSCPDHETRAVKCKHLWAIEYARRGTTAHDGSTKVTETMRITYSQNWPAYNAAQVEEKDRVQVLLRALCDGIKNPVKRGRGRPRVLLADVVHACAMKVFVGLSGRRAQSDIRESAANGHIGRAPGYNTMFDYMGRPELTPLLRALIEESAAPIAAVDLERAYGFDATGFGTRVYRRWFDHKYGREMEEATWMKVNIGIGVRSKIVTAVKVTEGTVNDSPQLPELLETTVERFKVGEVLADKGYISLKNLEAIAKIGAVAYIPFKSNNQAKGPELWRKAYHLFAFHREEFLRHYHQRSNVEAVFSAIKRKFGPAIRSRTFDAMVNESLLKVLCHNLTVLVRAVHELGLEPMFWMKAAPPTIVDAQ